MRGASLLFTAVLVLNGTAAAQSDSGVALYEATIRTMATLPIPPYIAYRLDGEGQSPRPMQTWLRLDDQKRIWLMFSRGHARSAWLVLHRSRDFSNAITDEARASFYTRRSFFDITWDGAYHALHDGILFDRMQREPKPIPTSAARSPIDCGTVTITSVSVPGAYNIRETGAAPHPVSSPSPPPCREPAQVPLDPQLRTIAFLRVMGPAAYAVNDGGTVKCENGDAGRLLHFTPRSDPDGHQLTDAIIDVRLMRFCMMRFREPQSAAIVEQHYATVGGYWVQTDGVVSYDFAVPLPGGGYQPNLAFPVLPSWDDTYRARFTWAYHITGIAFPASVPDDRFTPERR